jgi:hypothetical protein
VSTPHVFAVIQTVKLIPAREMRCGWQGIRRRYPLVIDSRCRVFEKHDDLLENSVDGMYEELVGSRHDGADKV